MAHRNTDITKQLREYTGSSEDASWVILKSSLGGRGLFASKPINSGSLIFTNKPLVIGARADMSTIIHCSTCYKISDSCVPCEKCQLYKCSNTCKRSQDHLRECEFIETHLAPKFKSEENSVILAQILIYLRFLLLSDDQNDLLNLLQRSSSQSTFQELDDLCSRYHVPEEVVQKIKEIYSIMKINSFRVSNSSHKNKTPIRGLYPLSAFLNHSCLPNTRNVFMADNTMAVYATQNIGAGEEILSCYTGLLWCTPARRLQLYKSKSFWCSCERCRDSSENGTNLSALKCFNKSCLGVLLPKDPLDLNTAWCCDMCYDMNTAERVNMVQNVLGSLVGTLHLDNKFKLENAVLDRLAKFIPYNNHIFVDIRLRLALKLGNDERNGLNELSESRLALKEKLCRGALRTLAALGAGDAHLRGLLLYHLHASLAERARRSPDQYEELKSEIERSIEQAYTILQGDISSPPDLELRHKYLGPGCDKPHEERFFILDASDTCVSI